MTPEQTDWRIATVDPLALQRWTSSRLPLAERARLAVNALTDCDACLRRACVPLDARALDRFLVVHGVEPGDVHPNPESPVP